MRRPLPRLPFPHLDRPATDDLLIAAGRGSLNAYAAFYDRTAPAIVGFLSGALPEPGAAAERVYLTMWRTAPSFDPSAGSAFTQLLAAARRELVAPILAKINENRAAPSGH